MYLRCRLDEILKERKLTIRKAVEITGVNFETIRKLRNNDSLQWHRDSLAKLMDGLGVSINELIEVVEGDRPATSLEKKAEKKKKKED